MSESDKMAMNPPSPLLVPEPPNFHAPQPTTDTVVPVIFVSESGFVLDGTLRFWYPGAEPIASQTLDELREVLEVVKRLREYLDEDPVAVFAIACHHEWKDLALEAANSSLRLPIRAFESAHPPHLSHLTVDMYRTLLHYHSECGKVAKPASASLKWTICKEIPGWFTAYLTALPDVLAMTPAARLDDPKMLAPALRALHPQCEYCAPNGFENLMEFALSLRAYIATKIDSTIPRNLYTRYILDHLKIACPRIEPHVVWKFLLCTKIMKLRPDCMGWEWHSSLFSLTSMPSAPLDGIPAPLRWGL
ncbi:hypothetical protein DFH09DRAFT_1095465 [Mycena vulgaris]|nr:hypothetical protein DFH09DRAFT_1095465 [Mycena vulgaris]